MSETDGGMWRGVRDELAIFGRLVRVENALEKGTPDVAYCLRRPVLGGLGVAVEGWLELKHLDDWPARPDTTVCVRKLTLDQVLWHEDWAAAGGRVRTLLRVGKGVRAEFLLLDAPLTRSVFERRLTRGSLTECCGGRGWRTVGKDRGRWLAWLTG